MSTSRHLAFLVVAIFCIQPGSCVQAAGLVVDPPAYASISVGFNLEQPVLTSNPGTIPSVDAAPGATVELALFLTGSNLSTPINSFAFSFSYPDLTDPSFFSQLPAGGTYTLGDNFFSAENESGSNFSPSHFEDYLGNFFFTIKSNVPVGTSFNLGQSNITSVASSGVGGNFVNAGPSDFVTVRVNVVPEPSAFWLLTSALFVFGLGLLRAGISTQRCR